MPEPLRWRHRTGEIVLDRTRVMGVLNVTPDSFSDGGTFLDPEAAVRHGVEMVHQGADLLDIGGESTRPGSAPVPADEEWRRVGPVVKALAEKVHVPLSIDTRKPEVAQHAIEAGASIVNDVSGLRDPRLLEILVRTRAGVVLMHMLGEPRTMQQTPKYADVVADVRSFLEGRSHEVVRAGVPREAIAIDPGIGFGKTLDHNLELLCHLDSLAGVGHPVVIGVSRKSFLGALGAGDVGERLAGSLAAAAFAVLRGAHVVRAHDVLETVRAMRVLDRLRSPR